jgi:exodeoxyribonuclease V alpha subunit
MQKDELFTVEGTVENIKFHNEANGWTVCEVLTDDGDTIVVVGSMPFINEGETIKAMGVWVTHASFGRQLKVEFFEKKLPAAEDSIIKYLSSGTIKGIGPSTANRIVELFGKSSFDIIENNPEKLAEIKGISVKKALEISDAFKSQFGIRNIMMFLQNFGISPATAVRIYKALGAGTIELVKSDPYLICDRVSGVGFDKADNIAMGLGFEQNSPERIRAGIKYTLRHNLLNGHTFLPYDKLISVACERLGVESEKAENELDFLVSNGSLKAADIGGVKAIYLERYYRAESYVALKLTTLTSLAYKKVDDIDVRIEKVQKELNIEFADLQRKALKEAVTSGAMVLTGGPGTGKTTTLKGIITILEAMQLKITLCAPTGRAAKRMTELTGREAKTIHRLLEMEYSDETAPRFGRDEQNPLEAQVIIVDELSMVDILLFEALLRAMRTNTRIIMVGDADQLPSVGAGNVLADIIASGCIEVVELTEIFRQARESMIIVNSHLINHGKDIDISRKDSDFFMLQCENASKICDTVVDLYSNRLPKSYGTDIKESLQVITPTKKTEAGTVNLNKILQSVLNPPRPD